MASPIYIRRLKITVKAGAGKSVYDGASYPYQIDLSSTMNNDAAFKSSISSAANIVVYDPVADALRPRIVNLDLTNNKLFLSWDGISSSTNDRVYWVLTGDFAAVDSSATFTNSSITHAWLLDEAAGASTVDSAGSATGTSSGTVSLGQVGKIGRGASGTGGIGKIALGAIDITGDITVSMVFKNNGTYSAFARLMYTQYLSLGIKENGTQLIFTRNNYATYINNIGNIAIGEWYHVSIVSPANSANITYVYINGVRVASASGISVLGSNPANAFLLSADGSNAVNGSIDNVIVSNGALLHENLLVSQSNMLMNPSAFFTVGQSSAYSNSKILKPSSPRGYGYAKRY